MPTTQFVVGLTRDGDQVPSEVAKVETEAMHAVAEEQEEMEKGTWEGREGERRGGHGMALGDQSGEAARE